MHRSPPVADFFANGNVAGVVILFMSAELIVLILVRRKFCVEVSRLELVVSLSAGAALILALRDALRGSAWQRIAGWLLAALICHLWDLKLRLATRRTSTQHRAQ